MARKTYHHLAEGDEIILQHYQWVGTSEEVLEEVPGRVARVLKSRVEIEFDMRVWTPDTPWNEQETFTTFQHFSRQGGQRWGAGGDDYHIHPRHAQKKV